MSRDGSLLCLFVWVLLSAVLCTAGFASVCLYPNGDVPDDQRWNGPWEVRDMGDYDYECARDLDGYCLANHNSGNYDPPTIRSDVFDLDDYSGGGLGAASDVWYTCRISSGQLWNGTLLLNLKVGTGWKSAQTVSIPYDGEWYNGYKEWGVYGWNGPTGANTARIQAKGNSNANPTTNPYAWIVLDQTYLEIASQ